VSGVALEGIEKRFGDTVVVRGISLEVHDGELLALLGPSGSGKTTLLRLIAGFERADTGRIRLGDRDVTAQDALHRRCGMVFQHYALFPHLTVGENVAYGLADAGLDRPLRDARVSEALALVDLAGLEARPVTALSGGQQQRVAVARALAPRPAVLLLDEPLSNLDPSLRERTRRELRELVSRIGITTILVTHEQEEAFELADRVALLLDGHLAQVGSPEALYREPASMAVARFVGLASRVPGRIVARHGVRATVESLGITLDASAPPGLEGNVDLMLRPEGLRAGEGGPLTGVVTGRRFLGASDLLTVAVGEYQVAVLATPMIAAIGDRLELVPTGIGAHAFEPAA
jgi:iron(III) transport system ATP-binding protein